MLAQTAAALIAFVEDETFDKIVYLMNVESSKFRKPVSREKIFEMFKPKIKG